MKLLTRRFWVRAGLLFVVASVAIQFVPYGRDHANPLAGAEPAWDSPDTRALAKEACFDCHSNEMEWPAYSSVAPVSWLIQHDVSEGRAVLNFSEWQRPQEQAKEAAEEVLEGEMRLRMYQLMHAHARLSAADRERLALRLERTLGRARTEAARVRIRACFQVPAVEEVHRGHPEAYTAAVDIGRAWIARCHASTRSCAL